MDDIITSDFYGFIPGCGFSVLELEQLLNFCGRNDPFPILLNYLKMYYVRSGPLLLYDSYGRATDWLHGYMNGYAIVADSRNKARISKDMTHYTDNIDTDPVITYLGFTIQKMIMDSLVYLARTRPTQYVELLYHTHPRCTSHQLLGFFNFSVLNNFNSDFLSRLLEQLPEIGTIPHKTIRGRVVTNFDLYHNPTITLKQEALERRPDDSLPSPKRPHIEISEMEV